jgi:hypothetical protein
MSKDFDGILSHIRDMSPAEMGISAELMGMSSSHADILHQFQSDSQSARNATDRSVHFDHLLETPGTDLVLTVANEGVKALPKAGWIIDAMIAPGHNGKIKAYKFEGTSFKVSDSTDQAKLVDNLEKFGSARVYASFQGESNKTHALVYENPDYPFKDKPPYDRSGTNYLGYDFEDLDSIPLNNGGRVLSQHLPVTYLGGLSTNFDTEDLSRKSKREYAPYVELNRITESLEELGHVIGHLALGMGLSPEDSAILVETSIEQIQ